MEYIETGEIFLVLVDAEGGCAEYGFKPLVQFEILVVYESVHIWIVLPQLCLGKTPKNTHTDTQKRALRRLLEELHERYPKALIVGHHDLDPMKMCPCFDVVSEYMFN